MNEVRDLILKTLVETNKEWTPTRHYPSSAGFKYSDGRIIGPDLLSQYLKWTGVKPSNPSDGEGLIKMKLGNGAHGVLAETLAQAGVKVLSETPFRVKPLGLDHEVSGRSDFLIELNNNELEVIEAKSSQDAMMFGTKYYGGLIKEGPKEDHKLQVICYLNCIPGLKRGRFLYIARDTGRMLEYIMDRDGVDSYAIDGVHVPELSWAGIVARWVELERIVKSGIAPAPEYQAWINDKTGEVMAKKTINGNDYKTHWRVLYDGYKDRIWKDPSNYQYSFNAKPPAGVQYAR